jgi:hypothetical protein
MNTPLVHRARQSGSVLLISLITCAIIGTVLASYLVLIQSQAISVTRSQSWNAGIALTEAGIEEALSHMNRNAPFFDPADATNNLSANNWTRDGNVFRAPRRYLGSNYYDVTITLNGMQPYINSTGVVWMASSYSSAPSTFFATVGQGTSAGGAFQGRQVLVNTKFDPMFDAPMLAELTIELNGKNITTDSFDSADPNFSDNGQYPMNNASKQKDGGNVYSNHTIKDSLDVGNAKIKGRAKTGPNGTIGIGPQGSVGSKAWVEGGKTGIEPGYGADDMNVYLPPVSLPNATWIRLSPNSQTIDGQTYRYAVLSSGNYWVPEPDGSIYIGTNVNANIIVTGDYKLSGSSDQIRIAGQNASLKLYMQGGTFALGGQGLVNETGNAANFYYYGLPSNTKVSFGGNASFTGAIYAPNADFSLGGGGKDTYDFVGASVTKTVQMNGHFNFHYDENLRRVGPGRGFIPTNWKEL